MNNVRGIPAHLLPPAKYDYRRPEGYDAARALSGRSFQVPQDINDDEAWRSTLDGMTDDQKLELWLALHVANNKYVEPPRIPAIQRVAESGVDNYRPDDAPPSYMLSKQADYERRLQQKAARSRAMHEAEVQLSAGSESRLDGAPNSHLPAYEEAVDAVSIRMLEEAGLPTTPEYKAQMRQQAEERVNAEIQRSRLPDSPPAAPAPPPEVRSYVPDMPAGPRGGVIPTPEWSDAKIEELTNAILSQPGFGSGPDARARARSMAENEVRNLRMTRWQSQRQAAGDPHRDFASEFGGSVPDYEMSVPAPISNDPANLRGDDLEAYQRMVGEGAVSPGEQLTPEQVAEVRRRSAVRWHVRTDNERYGPYWMGDQEIADLAEANRPYTAPPASETMKGAAGLVRPSLPVGWSPEGATVPPPLTGAGPALPAGPSGIDQATSGISPGGKPMRVDDPDTAPLPSLWNQMDSRGVQSGANVPLPGQTDPRYEFWHQQRQAREAGRVRQLNDPYMRERQIKRMALRAGISYEEAAAIADAGRAEILGAEGGDRPLTPSEHNRSFAGLRAKMHNAEIERTLERRKRRSEMAMLAGGQPTGGIGGTRAAYAQEMFQRDRIDALLGRLSQEGVSDWERAGIMAQLAPNANTANPTPLGVDAVGAQNAMRMMNAEALAGMDPERRKMAQQQQDIMLMNQPPEVQIRVSIQRGEPMGAGLSAAPVQSAWNTTVNGWGTEADFRRKMENAGYSPEQIDAWIDARRDDEQPPAPGNDPAAWGGGAPAGTPAGPQAWGAG